MITPESAHKTMRRWVEDVIIGLNLCPWAKPVYERGGLHFTVSDVASPERVIVIFLQELELLLITPGRESTLLALPNWIISFELFNDVVGMLEDELERMQLASNIQVVPFHPGFVFADTSPESKGNWVNRSPFPIIHFLQVEDVQQATQGNIALAEGLSLRNDRLLSGMREASLRRLFPYLF